MSELVTMTLEEWRARAAELFGPDPLDWRFVCPSCGHEASVRDWRDVGAPEGGVAFSCVGRYIAALDDAISKRSEQYARNAFRGAGGPCNYTGGGLFKLNPVTVIKPDGEKGDFFAFAPPRLRPELHPVRWWRDDETRFQSRAQYRGSRDWRHFNLSEIPRGDNPELDAFVEHWRDTHGFLNPDYPPLMPRFEELSAPPDPITDVCRALAVPFGLLGVKPV